MENELIKKAITVLENQKRPEQITQTVYGEYTPYKAELIYNDDEHRYSSRQTHANRKEVRSVNSFIDVIKEELRRRENTDGNKATVGLNLEGGYFIADENKQKGFVKYSRLNSQQWVLFRSGINKRMDHKEFLLFLQALKPSIDNFQDVFSQFVQLRLIGHSEITSNPIITADGQSCGYSCTYKLEDGTDGDAQFPTGFSLNLQFAKAGVMNYDVNVDLLFYRDEGNELMIQVLCPEFEHIEETAIIDESNEVKEKTSQYTKLLVLSDF